MPLAFATLLGGMATLFTTTNIIASGILRTQNLPGFGVLDFLPVGGPMAIAGIVFLALWGLRLLPARDGMDGKGRGAIGQADLVGVYRLGERLFRARIPAGSSLIGKPLAGSTLRETYGVTVVAVERQSQMIPVTSPETTVAEGDVVVLEGNLDEFRQRVPSPIWKSCRRESGERAMQTASTVIFEAVLAPRSGLLGQTLRVARFREKYGMAVLGVWRQGQPIRTNLGDLPLQFGMRCAPRAAQQPQAYAYRARFDFAGQRAGGENSRRRAGQGSAGGGHYGGDPGAGNAQPGVGGGDHARRALLMVLAGLFTMDQVYAPSNGAASSWWPACSPSAWR